MRQEKKIVLRLISIIYIYKKNFFLNGRVAERGERHRESFIWSRHQGPATAPAGPGHEMPPM